MKKKSATLLEDKPHPVYGHPQRISAIVGMLILALYAGFFRWAFGQTWMVNSGGVVSLSFIWGVPFALGF